MGTGYYATIAEFLTHAEHSIIGQLTSAYEHNELQRKQTLAWSKTVGALREAFAGLSTSYEGADLWHLFLEYSIPRRQRTIDAVILAADLIFCNELKTE